jgi:hypothetical protein
MSAYNITAEDLSNWNSAYSNSHIHKNKSVIDDFVKADYTWVESARAKIALQYVSANQVIIYDSTSTKIKNKHSASLIGYRADLIINVNGTGTPTLTELLNNTGETFSASRISSGIIAVTTNEESITYASNTTLVQATLNNGVAPQKYIVNGYVSDESTITLTIFDAPDSGLDDIVGKIALTIIKQG